MTAREILQKNKIGTTNNWLAKTVDQIVISMEEYAEQEKIKVAKEWLEMLLPKVGQDSEAFTIIQKQLHIYNHSPLSLTKQETK